MTPLVAPDHMKRDNHILDFKHFALTAPDTKTVAIYKDVYGKDYVYEFILRKDGLDITVDWVVSRSGTLQSLNDQDRRRLLRNVRS